jgi:hypothetical protein
MPAGPPPGPANEEEDSDDDIPMPEGPPPGQSFPQGLFVSFWYVYIYETNQRRTSDASLPKQSTTTTTPTARFLAK